METMTINEICKIGQMSKSHFWRLRRNEQFPPPVINLSLKFQRWKKSDVESFFQGTWTKKAESKDEKSIESAV